MGRLSAMGPDRWVRVAIVVVVIAGILPVPAADAQVLQFGKLVVVASNGEDSFLAGTRVELWEGSKGQRGSVAALETDNDGNVAFDVAPGLYQVRVTADAVLRVSEVNVSAREETRVNATFGVLVVQPTSAGGPVEARVAVMENNREIAVRSTDHRGNATFVLPEAAYGLRVGADNTLSISRVPVTAANVTIQPAAFGHVRVDSIAGNHIPESSVPVVLGHRIRELAIRGKETGISGGLDLDVAPGTYDLEVDGVKLGATNVTAGNVTAAATAFGSLLIYAKNEAGDWTSADVRIEKKGTRRAFKEFTVPPSSGVGSTSLPAGAYDIRVTEGGGAKATFYGVEIAEYDVIRLGDYGNHDPVIQGVTIRPLRVNVGESLTLDVRAIDPDRDNVTYEFTSDSGTIVANGSRATYTEEGRGIGLVTVVVRDTAGGIAKRDLHVSNVAGTLAITIEGVDGPLVDTPIKVVSEITRREVASGKSDQNGAARFTVPVGLYRVEATRASTLTIEHVLVPPEGASYVVSSTRATDAPTITHSSPADSEVPTRLGGSVPFELRARDPGGGRPQYRWYVDDEYASSNSAFPYSPGAESVGWHTVRGVATNGVNESSRTWRVNVTQENHPPRIIAMGAEKGEVIENSLVTLSVAAIDPDGDPITIQWSTTNGTLDNATSLNPVWRAPEMKEPYDVKITVIVRDKETSAKADLIITVKPTPPKPGDPDRVDEPEAELNETVVEPPKERVPGPGTFLASATVAAVALLLHRRRTCGE